MTKNKASRIKGAIAASLMLAFISSAGIFEASAATPGSVSASEAFVTLPAQTLDLLTKSMRRDLLDYYTQRDSIYEVANTLEGLSYLHRPLTADYLKVQVTPVTTLTLRVLPAKKGPVVMTIYTLGDSVQAKDSEIRFYDAAMNELKRDKFIKMATTKDFLDLKDVDSKQKRELLESVPFPTVEYEVSPDSDLLTARLTVGEFLGKETMDRLKPYLKPEISYRWNGKEYKPLE